ncbi:reverse transcriptase domain-containing protein [Tanacetum coccineum]
MSSFEQRSCFNYGNPVDDQPCRYCTCERCGYYNRGVPCLGCNSEAKNSFTYEPTPHSYNDSPNFSDYPPTPLRCKTMTDAQAHYTTTEKELLAVVYAFEKFRRYLVLSKTIVFTDHSALKYLLAKQDAKTGLLRWILLLQEFDVIIRDKKEAENLAADHLSRLENPHQDDLEKKEITETFPLETLGMISFYGDSNTPWFVDIANYHAGNFIGKGMSSQQKKKFFKDKPLISSRLAIMDPPGDIMVRTTPLTKSSILVSFGRLFTKMPMIWSHDVTLVNVKAKSCNVMKCLCEIFNMWGINFMGPFPSSRGNKYILVAIDYLSKWVEAKALPTNDALVVVMLKYGVTHRLSTAYHPQMSGQVEAFRTSFKTPIGCTPYKLMYEKACYLPIELEHKAYWALKHCNFDLKTTGDHRKVQMNELNDLRDQAYENSLIYKEKTKKIHDSKIKNIVFNVGIGYLRKGQKQWQNGQSQERDWKEREISKPKACPSFTNQPGPILLGRISSLRVIFSLLGLLKSTHRSRYSTKDYEDWLIAPVTPPGVAAPVRLDTPLSFATTTPLPIDLIMLPDHETTTFDFLPWIPRPYTDFISVPIRLEELASLHVRLDGIKSIQTKLRRSDRAIVRDVGWLGERDEIIQRSSLVRRVDGLIDDQAADSIVISELHHRMATIEERVQTLVKDDKYVQDVLDVVDTEIAELRDRVDDYPREQVDTLRVEVDGLHGSAATTSQRVQTLETALQEARTETQDLQTCLCVK